VTTTEPVVRRRDLPGSLVALEALPPDRPSGPPVVLVPGYTGTKEDFAAILAPLAATGRHLLAIDQRGQFESKGPDSPAAYTVDALAADLLAVIGELGGTADVIGHSFGGLVARAAAIASPAAVASLVLLDSGPAAIAGDRRERMEALEPILATHGMPGVYAALELLASGDPTWVAAPQEHKDFLRRRFLESSPVGLQAMGDALRAEPDRTAALAATGVPVLVAYGEADDAWPPAEQARMAVRLGAPSVSIAGAIHSPALQQPARTVEALLGFWTGLPGR
jgi:pimeloyl-ACP methyl ester carboxylesterase